VSTEPNQSFNSLLASLSPDPHTRGKQFERLAKWWLTQDPKTALEVKQAWLWDEWPDRSGPDIGIDIVAEMCDGTLCAIQAKCFDENRDIPKSELDSFISAASNRTFQHRWLIATTDRLSANARRMLDDQHVTRKMRSHLEESLDIWPTSIDELNPIQRTKYSPLPHQQLAITDVVTGLASNTRGQLIMACGTGKTLTALWIKETLKPRTTLVLVPSLNLLAQTLAEWAKNTSSPWNYLCVCSDDTVNKSDDQPISTVGDLPFDVTTNAEQISTFLSLSGEKIIFSTYQSSAQVAKAQELTGTAFDLVICDEAHRLTGKTDANYATVLDEKKIVAEKRLFMTATPRTYTTAAKSKAEDRGVEITSMDDEHIYGPVLHKLSFGEAIKQELLSDYRVLIVGVTDPQVQDLIDRRELVSVNDSVTTDAQTLAAHIGLAKATKDYNLKRTISFHSRIKTADQFARDHAKILEWLPESHKPSGETWMGTISGAMNTGDRRKLLTQLRLDGEDRHAILTNARCLTEGVDVPSLDGVAFIDPRSSQVDIIQAVGRAIRKSENKEIGTIVLPVLIPTDADAERALEDTAFKPIWAILNALKSHDEELAVELSDLRTQLGRNEKLGHLPSRLVEDLPANIDSLVPNFSEKLSVAVVERSTTNWDFMYGRLQRYVIEHGHASPPALKIGRDWLSQWVADQRSKYNSKTLDSQRIARLESLPGWTWDPIGDSWNSFFERLQEYSNEFGHAAVPMKPRLYRGRALASWVNNQRTKFNKGELEQEKIALLESVDGWTWAPKGDQFARGFRALEQYVARTGRSRVPSGHIEVVDDVEINLGRWTTTRRRDYKRGWLTTKQIEAFEALPDWSWNQKDDDWESWFSLLLEFVNEYGHALVPQGSAKALYKEHDLSSWVNSQRGRYKNGSLEEHRIVKLETVKGWSWRPYDDAWEGFYNRYLELASSDVGVRFEVLAPEEASQITGWLGRQRSQYFKNKLDPEKIRRIELIPSWEWNPQAARWGTFYEALVKFAETNGHSRPPRSVVVEGMELGEWVKARRSEFNSGKLSASRIQQLESLPGWTWDPFEDAWQEFYTKIQEEIRHNDNTLPKVFTDKKISNWITRQRKLFTNNQLPEHRIKLLEELNGWSWDYEKVKQSNWDEMFNILCIYVHETGDARVRDKSTFRGVKLGTWVAVQRRRNAEGTITENQRKRLEALNRWSWNPIEDDWHETYQALISFLETNGHIRPSRRNPDESELSQWIGVQRTSYKNQKISQERITLLESIPDWTWSARNEATLLSSWETSFEAVKSYSERNGNVRASKTHRENGVPIASWISIQRKKYIAGSLSPKQIRQLESIDGWAWDVFNESWESQYLLALQFAEREGHAKIPQRHVEDGIDLGTWVNGQRTNYANGKLSSERIARLEEIPGWTWNPKQAGWTATFNLLLQFVERNGSAHVPDGHVVEGVQLGKWVGKQRQKFKNGQLEIDRARLLEALPGWLWSAKKKHS
jgi:superfamily II DNA or RNA helicase